MRVLKWEVDALLQQWAAQGLRRISPSFVSRHLENADAGALTSYLLTSEKLMARYEVECPFGHSDFVVTDPSRIPTDPRQCRLCTDAEPYVPDPNRIWLTFEFNGEYLQFLKKKSLQPQPPSPLPWAQQSAPPH